MVVLSLCDEPSQNRYTSVGYDPHNHLTDGIRNLSFESNNQPNVLQQQFS